MLHSLDRQQPICSWLHTGFTSRDCFPIGHYWISTSHTTTNQPCMKLFSFISCLFMWAEALWPCWQTATKPTATLERVHRQAIVATLIMQPIWIQCVFVDLIATVQIFFFFFFFLFLSMKEAIWSMDRSTVLVIVEKDVSQNARQKVLNSSGHLSFPRSPVKPVLTFVYTYYSLWGHILTNQTDSFSRRNDTFYPQFPKLTAIRCKRCGFFPWRHDHTHAS